MTDLWFSTERDISDVLRDRILYVSGVESCSVEHRNRSGAQHTIITVTLYAQTEPGALVVAMREAFADEFVGYVTLVLRTAEHALATFRPTRYAVNGSYWRAL
jgi:hypothetical protein